jgi:hypothetical protein
MTVAEQKVNAIGAAVTTSAISIASPAHFISDLGMDNIP